MSGSECLLQDVGGVSFGLMHCEWLGLLLF